MNPEEKEFLIELCIYTRKAYDRWLDSSDYIRDKLDWAINAELDMLIREVVYGCYDEDFAAAQTRFKELKDDIQTTFAHASPSWRKSNEEVRSNIIVTYR
jgi:hypothetical protein